MYSPLLGYLKITPQIHILNRTPVYGIIQTSFRGENQSNRKGSCTPLQSVNIQCWFRTAKKAPPSKGFHLNNYIMNKLSQLDPSIERLPSNIRNFLKKFYNLLDGESSKAAKEWSEMFRENGQFICASKTQTGRKGKPGQSFSRKWSREPRC